MSPLIRGNRTVVHGWQRDLSPVAGSILREHTKPKSGLLEASEIDKFSGARGLSTCGCTGKWREFVLMRTGLSPLRVKTSERKLSSSEFYLDQSVQHLPQKVNIRRLESRETVIDLFQRGDRVQATAELKAFLCRGRTGKKCGEL